MITFGDYIIQKRGEVFYKETVKDLTKYQGCITLEHHLSDLYRDYLLYIEKTNDLLDTQTHVKWFETPELMAKFISINDAEIHVHTAVVQDGNFNKGYYLIFRGPINKNYG